MIQVRVVLYSVFREKLPREAHGRTTLEMPEGSTIQSVLDHLDIHIHALCSINGVLVYDFSRTLQNGDELQLFRPVGGG
jgi:sulfur carrier protein ThiS